MQIIDMLNLNDIGVHFKNLNFSEFDDKKEYQNMLMYIL